MKNAWRFVRGVSRGLAVGTFFPTRSDRPAASAPGGSEETPLPPRRGADLPGGLVLSRHRLALAGLERPLRLLQLSDVHLRGPAPWVGHLLDRVSERRPDLVLLTGDIVTRGWSEAVIRSFLDALPDAPLGRFAVMGNWEHWADAPPARWSALLAEHGVRLLQDEIVHLSGLRLAGTDDLLAGVTDPVGLRARLPPGAPTVVLSHSPAILPALAGPGVDLVLSGHAHGGQLRLPGLGALWVPRGTGAQVAGWYEERGTHQFVSRGVGWSIAPVRLRCPPELVEIELLPG